MALTYTDAGHQAQLDAYHAAVVSRTWDSALEALIAAVAIESHLALSGGADGVSLTRPSARSLLEGFDKLRGEIAKADAAVSGATGQRFAVARTQFNVGARW